jgi:hypothetical protein
MKSIITKIGLTCLALFIALGSAARTGRVATEDFTSDDDLIIGARAIVIGRVLSVTCLRDADEDRIFTYVTLRIEENLKGEIGGARIVLKEEGGEVAGQGSVIFGTPQFSRGERVFLYLDTRLDGSLRVHQMSFGKLSVVEDLGNGSQTVVRSEPGCGVIVKRATRHPHFLGSPSDSMELSDYSRIVRARLAANWDRSRAFQMEHYREVPMLAQPREYQRAMSGGAIHPQFHLLYPVKSVRWFEPDNNQPIVFYVNPDGAPNPQVVEDVGASLIAWSNVAGCTLRLVNGGFRNVCSTQRNVNAISFNNCDGRFSPSPDCARIIALGGLRWTSEETKQVNGQTYVPAAYGFVSFNPYSACSFDNHCDLREIATHELGHALGLGHSQHPEATMFGSAHFDGRCASITEDDANGIAFIYPVNDLGSRPLAIGSASLLPDAVNLVDHLQALTSSGGVLPHTWSVVDFLGRMPAGVSLSTGGIIFGLPIESGTFNFTLQVNDSQGNSVQKRFSLTVRDPLPFDSQFISQTVVSTIQAGQQFSTILKWLNNGSQIWDVLSGLKVVSQNPANNATWGTSSPPISGITLKGQQLEIRIAAVAPRVAGTYNFQWQLYQEGRGFFGQPSASLSIIVTPGPPSIDGSVPPQAFVGSSFSYQLTVAGGTPPYVWSIASGSLPSGLGLDSHAGLISGIPTAAGSATFTAQVTDATSRAAQGSFSITVAAAPTLPLRLNVAASLQAVKGTPFNYQPEATGGTPPYTWSITSGALPTGLALNGSAGAISGTPAAGGDFGVTITLRDQRNQTATGSIQIRVTEPEPAPVITKVKYKVGKRQLIVSGDRIDPNAALVVDGMQVSARFDAGALIAKPVPLTSGTHEIRVVNSSGVSSQPYSFTVE